MTWEPEDAEIRRNALALHKAMRAAEDAYGKSDETDRLPPEGEAELRAVDADYYARSGALRDEHRAKYDAVMAKYAPPGTTLKSIWEGAERAYMDAPGDALAENDDGDAVICAKSGLPIFETDEVVEDPDTGEVFLRAALGLPPRKDQDELEEAA